MSDATELLPCPHCGERLVLKGDHHGDWWGHHNDATGSCIHSVTQLMDAEDFAAWNRRSALATPLAPAAPEADGWREIMWGEVVEGYDDDEGIVFKLCEEGNRDGDHFAGEIKLKASTFSVGTKISIREPSAAPAVASASQADKPACFKNHHKYVGKCPYCHTELPDSASQADTEETTR